ncbi:MAG: hypothetical protein HC815_37005 [Richelia sp. RM1_1_1]|nr:hypothetical protein [Richelia sp. RM1_1_1]
MKLETILATSITSCCRLHILLVFIGENSAPSSTPPHLYPVLKDTAGEW